MEVGQDSTEVRRPVVEDGVALAALDGVKAMMESMGYFDFMVDKVEVE